MPTSKKLYPDRHTLASGIFHGERNESRDTSTEWLDAIKEQVEVLYYAAMVCGPGALTRIDTRWIGFCPIGPNTPSHGMRKTFAVDHEANDWSCSACGMGGDVVDLVKAITRCDHDGAAAHVLMSAFHILQYAEVA
jgi:CHC2 zinc finger